MSGGQGHISRGGGEGLLGTQVAFRGLHGHDVGQHFPIEGGVVLGDDLHPTILRRELRQGGVPAGIHDKASSDGLDLARGLHVVPGGQRGIAHGLDPLRDQKVFARREVHILGKRGDRRVHGQVAFAGLRFDALGQDLPIQGGVVLGGDLHGALLGGEGRQSGVTVRIHLNHAFHRLDGGGSLHILAGGQLGAALGGDGSLSQEILPRRQGHISRRGGDGIFRRQTAFRGRDRHILRRDLPIHGDVVLGSDGHVALLGGEVRQGGVPTGLHLEISLHRLNGSRGLHIVLRGQREASLGVDGILHQEIQTGVQGHIIPEGDDRSGHRQSALGGLHRHGVGQHFPIEGGVVLGGDGHFILFRVEFRQGGVPSGLHHQVVFHGGDLSGGRHIPFSRKVDARLGGHLGLHHQILAGPQQDAGIIGGDRIPHIEVALQGRSHDAFGQHLSAEGQVVPRRHLHHALFGGEGIKAGILPHLGQDVVFFRRHGGFRLEILSGREQHIGSSGDRRLGLQILSGSQLHIPHRGGNGSGHGQGAFGGLRRHGSGLHFPIEGGVVLGGDGHLALLGGEGRQLGVPSGRGGHIPFGGAYGCGTQDVPLGGHGHVILAGDPGLQLHILAGAQVHLGAGDPRQGNHIPGAGAHFHFATFHGA